LIQVGSFHWPTRLGDAAEGSGWGHHRVTGGPVAGHPVSLPVGVRGVGARRRAPTPRSVVPLQLAGADLRTQVVDFRGC